MRRLMVDSGRNFRRIRYNEHNDSQSLESISHLITGDRTKSPFVTDATYDQIQLIESIEDSISVDERDKYYAKYIEILEEKSHQIKFEIGYVERDNTLTARKRYLLRSTDGYQHGLFMSIFDAWSEEMDPVKEFNRNKSVTLRISEDREPRIDGVLQIKEKYGVLKISVVGKDVPHYFAGVAIMSILPALEDRIQKEIDRDRNISAYIKCVYREMWHDYYAVREYAPEFPHQDRLVEEQYISSSNPRGRFRGERNTPKCAFISLLDLPSYLQLMFDQQKTEGLIDTKFKERFKISCIQEKSEYRIHRTSKEVYEDIRERINDYIG